MVTKQDILGYVSFTPYNTNINVLGPMLDEFSIDPSDYITINVTFKGGVSGNPAILIYPTITGDGKNIYLDYKSIIGTTSFRMVGHSFTKSITFYVGFEDKQDAILYRDGKVNTVNKNALGMYPVPFKFDGEVHSIELQPTR